VKSRPTPILDLRLYQLTGLERDKIEAEYEELIKRIAYLQGLLASEKKLMAVVKQELLEVKEKYGDPRRTDIVADEGDIDIEDLIANEACIVTISHQGYVKRTAVSAYRAQRRGGKGVMGMEQREEDFIEHLFTCSTHDYLMFFTEQGRVHVEKVYELPEMGRAAKGKSAANFLQLKPDERIAALIRVKDSPTNNTLSWPPAPASSKRPTSTNTPTRAKAASSDQHRKRRSPHWRQTHQHQQRSGVGDPGRHEHPVPRRWTARPGPRNRRRLGHPPSKGDYVVGIEIVDPNATLLVAGERGIGKRTPFDEYRIQSRGGKGIITMKTSDKVGAVVARSA